MQTLNKILFILTFLMLYGKAQSQTINMQMRDTSASVNAFINIPIRANTTLTGRGVLAYKLQFTFNSALLSPQGVVTTGTISNALGAPTINTSVAGQITIAAAGTTALTGTGNFIFLRFKVIAAGYTGINNTGTDNNYFNEGNPAMNFTSNCYMNCIGLPTIYISPSTAVILKGQTQSFDASNGTAPYTWSSTNISVGTINSTGLFTANQIGTTTVKATDATSNVGTSGTIEVRGYSLYIPDTTGVYNSYMNIPVRTSNLTGLNILSGSFSIQYNTASMSDIQIITTGTLLASAPAPTLNNSIPNNRLQISFASATALSGAGVLFYIRCKLSNASGSYAYLNFESALMNETLAGITRNGYVYYNPPPSISISVPSPQLVYGDSMQLSVNNGTAPYVWSLSDSTLATINSSGVLKVKRSGILKVTVTDANSATSTTNNIQLYDTYIKIKDTAVAIGAVVDIPVYIKDLPVGQSVYSIQGKINAGNSNLFVPQDIIITGAGFEGGAVSKVIGSGYIQFAIASTSPIQGNTVLFYVRGLETTNNQAGWTNSLNFENLMINEGTPLPYQQSGTLTGKYVYVFNGNGNWSTSSNWQNGLVPPTYLDGTGDIIIDPIATGSCILNVPQYVRYGAKMQVKEGKKLIVPGNFQQ